jgi:hypothetical protein
MYFVGTKTKDLIGKLTGLKTGCVNYWKTNISGI